MAKPPGLVPAVRLPLANTKPVFPRALSTLKVGLTHTLVNVVKGLAVDTTVDMLGTTRPSQGMNCGNRWGQLVTLAPDGAISCVNRAHGGVEEKNLVTNMSQFVPRFSPSPMLPAATVTVCRQATTLATHGRRTTPQ